MKRFDIVSYFFFINSLFANYTLPTIVIPKELPSDTALSIEQEKADLDAEVLGIKKTKTKKNNSLRDALSIESNTNSKNSTSNTTNNLGVLLKESDQSNKAIKTGEINSKSGSLGVRASRINPIKKDNSTENSLTKGIFDEVSNLPIQKKVPSSPPTNVANSSTKSVTPSIPVTPSTPVTKTNPTPTPSASSQTSTPSPQAQSSLIQPIVINQNASIPAPKGSPIESTSIARSSSSNPQVQQNLIAPTAESKKCLQECIDYTEKLKNDRAVGGISTANNGSRIILRTASGIWVPDGQGFDIESNGLGKVFYEACEKGVGSNIDPNNNRLFNIDFKNVDSLEEPLKSAIIECKTKFAAISKADPFATASFTSFSNENEREFEELERKKRKEKAEGKTPKPLKLTNCLLACNKLLDVYNEGNTMVERVAPAGDDKNFSFITRDNFSWKENTSSTNPNLEEHNNFLEACKDAIRVSISIPDAKSFNISFNGEGSSDLKNQANQCRKNFKLASTGSPLSRNTASQDPFNTRVNDTNTPPNNGANNSQKSTNSTKKAPIKIHEAPQDVPAPKVINKK